MIRLDDLHDLALSGSNRSLDLQMFQFGSLRERRSVTGRVARVGELALHVRCPWRIVGESGLVVGSDHHEPEGSPSGALLERLVAAGLTVIQTSRDDSGFVRITLTSGYALELMPRTHATEQWRLFAPGRIDDDPVVYPPE